MLSLTPSGCSTPGNPRLQAACLQPVQPPSGCFQDLLFSPSAGPHGRLFLIHPTRVCSLSWETHPDLVSQPSESPSRSGMGVKRYSYGVGLFWLPHTHYNRAQPCYTAKHPLPLSLSPPSQHMNQHQSMKHHYILALLLMKEVSIP